MQLLYSREEIMRYHPLLTLPEYGSVGKTDGKGGVALDDDVAAIWTRGDGHVNVSNVTKAFTNR